MKGSTAFEEAILVKTGTETASELPGLVTAEALLPGKLLALKSWGKGKGRAMPLLAMQQCLTALLSASIQTHPASEIKPITIPP